MLAVSKHYSDNGHNEVKFRNFKSFDQNAFLLELSKNAEITDIEWSDQDFVDKWDKFKVSPINMLLFILEG